jgi:hypothetical protein
MFWWPGVFCSCNQRFIFRVYILKMYAFSALNTLWRLPGVFSWCLRRFWFRTYNRILFCTIMSVCCVSWLCIPWPSAFSVHSTLLCGGGGGGRGPCVVVDRLLVHTVAERVRGRGIAQKTDRFLCKQHSRSRAHACYNYAWPSENFLTVDLTLAWPASIQYVSPVCQCFCGSRHCFSSSVPSKEFSLRYVLFTFSFLVHVHTCILNLMAFLLW